MKILNFKFNGFFFSFLFIFWPNVFKKVPMQYMGDEAATDEIWEVNADDDA